MAIKKSLLPKNKSSQSGTESVPYGKESKTSFKPTSLHIKTALMSYYRYKRQMVCGDEVKVGAYSETCDVLVLDQGGNAFDLEVKISKSDLLREQKKHKHALYLNAESTKFQIPNIFYICVPTELVGEAEKWVDATNKKYGIIEFKTAQYKHPQVKWDVLIKFHRYAKLLHPKISPKWTTVLLKRLSSAVTTSHQNFLSRSAA